MGAVNLDKMVEKNEYLLECERYKIEIWKCEREENEKGKRGRAAENRPEAL
jgi:hypothetical protein